MAMTMPSHYQVEMDLDNNMVLVPDSTAGAIWQVDPNLLTVVGTLVADPSLKTPVYGMHFDHNGDLFVSPSGTLLKVDRFGTLTTVGGFGSSAQHMALDIATGDLIVGRSSSVYQLARDGSMLTTLGSGFSFRYGDMAQDILTGDLFVPTCCGWSGASLHVLRAGTSMASIYLSDSGLAGAYGPNMDRASAANRRIVTGSHIYVPNYPNSGGIWYIDLGTAAPVKLASFQAKTIGDSTILGSRELQTVRIANGQYDLRFNVPADAGKAFVAGLSFTGITPALPLPDGRRIPLVMDTFTIASINGWLVPFLTGNVGTLDAFGKATGKLDVSAMYNVVKGLRLWTILVVLDPKAPLGIASICDPKVLVL